MKRSKNAVMLFAAMALLMLPLVSLSLRAGAAEPVKEEPKKAAEVKKSELRSQMEDMDDDFKKLRRSCRKPEQNEQSLKLLTAIQQRCVTCKEITPERTAKVPEADRAKYVAAYRKEMDALIIDFCQMEQAILDGDNAKASELWKSIDARQDKDHDQFMNKDDKKAKDKEKKD